MLTAPMKPKLQAEVCIDLVCNMAYLQEDSITDMGMAMPTVDVTLEGILSPMSHELLL